MMSGSDEDFGADDYNTIPADDNNATPANDNDYTPAPANDYNMTKSISGMSVSNGDVRKDYILTTIANHFSLSASDNIVSGLVTDTKLNNFLDDGNSMLLSANLQKLPGAEEGGGSGSSTRIYLDNTVHVDSKDNKVDHHYRHH